MLHIAIIEPSSIIYEGLANMLLKSEHHYQICRLENLEEFEHSGIKHNFDVVVLNPALVQYNPRNFIQLKRAYASITWTALVYSYYDKEIIALFDSVLQITDPAETIVTTLNKQARTATGGTDMPLSEHITERETDVLIQLVHGLSNKEIADKLNISIHTVVSHRKNIIQKTGIKSQAGLTIYAISNKIITLDSFPD